MSRQCTSLTDGGKGPQCKNMIEDGHDYCAAKHYSPAKGPKVPVAPSAPAQSVATIDLDELLGATAFTQEAHDKERGAKRGAYLESFLAAGGSPIQVVHVGTLRGARTSVWDGETPRSFRLDRYKVPGLGTGLSRLACGRDGWNDKEWYLETDCTADGCKAPSFVRIKAAVRPSEDKEKAEHRAALFLGALKEAKQVPARCHDHRGMSENMKAEKAAAVAALKAHLALKAQQGLEDEDEDDYEGDET